MINNLTLMGRLTDTPELKTTTNGTSVTTFTLAVDRNFKGKDGEKQTDFINCVAWRGTGEFISRYFEKGSMIAIQGSIQTRKYEDKQGNKRTAFEVIAEQVSFCGGKSEDNEKQHTTPQGDFEQIDSDDDLPF